MVMGRPKKDDACTKSVTFKVTPSEFEKLNAYCTLTDQQRSTVIRNAVNEYIKPKTDKSNG